ncbi:MAG: electron transport complex subunit E [Christensenellales bacterium]|jgi:electron transport complex protein RnfE
MIKKSDIVKNGIIKNNPTFRLVLGTCPTLAVTTSVMNGISMGLATTFVLICSNIIISLLRNIIPDKVRIPAYILLIATFVIVVEMVLRAFLPDIYDALGLFISLIVVNCIILGRAESFASANTVLDSALDAVGIGAGFTFALMLMGFVRELLGAGSIFSWSIPVLSDCAMTIFILPAGGFFAYGFLMVIFNQLVKKAEERKKQKAEKGAER